MNPTTEINSLEERLDQVFRLNVSRLRRMEHSAALPLQKARDFGRVHGSAPEWHRQWDQGWAEISATLGRTEALFESMDAALQGSAPEDLIQATATWEQVQAEDQQLVASVQRVRALAQTLDPKVRAEWNPLALSMEALLDLMTVCAQTLSIRLLLETDPAAAELRDRVQGILAKLPLAPGADDLESVRYFMEYQKAINELANHNHDALGLFGAVKALFMWADTPTVQLAPDRSLQVAIGLPVEKPPLIASQVE